MSIENVIQSYLDIFWTRRSTDLTPLASFYGLLKTAGLWVRSVCWYRPFGKNDIRRMPKNYSKYDMDNNERVWKINKHVKRDVGYDGVLVDKYTS